MGKPLRIAISLNTLHNNADRAVTRAAAIRINDVCGEFDHAHAYIACRTLAHMPLLAEHNAYRVILQSKCRVKSA
ncbi:unnamed protein product [Litomosoides sigmodontis]|uniref:Uncharacterized protein n=1 Tax=Litomosoides sigmodontis TaxID=42156 RepID=A0A3P6SMD5_LITSI|nr:unnamed protein product [Litomosoides sigmodontis]